MSVTFPTTLDALTNPISTNPLNNPSQSAQHADENDAIEALEAKVGIDSSAVTTSHDYKLSLIATGQKVVGNDGWTSAGETWTWNDATHITVITGAASKYQKGDKWKLTANSVVLQGYVVTVADTVLTVVGDTLTNNGFSANFYSHQQNPMGFPKWFVWTPTVTWTNGPTTPATTARFTINGTTVHFYFEYHGTASGTPTTQYIITCPVKGESNGSNHAGGFSALVNGTTNDQTTSILARAIYWKGDNTTYVNFASTNVTQTIMNGTYELD